jgi:hypothetical protein
MTFFILAVLALGAGQLLNLQPLFALNLLFSIAGVIIYLVRLAPRLSKVSWLGRGSERFFALSALFIVADIALTAYLVVHGELHVLRSQHRGSTNEHFSRYLDLTLFTLSGCIDPCLLPFPGTEAKKLDFCKLAHYV